MNENVLFRGWLPLLAGLLFCLLLCACGEQASAAHPALPVGTTQPSGSAQTLLTVPFTFISPILLRIPPAMERVPKAGLLSSLMLPVM